jgi:hypothetical protein
MPIDPEFIKSRIDNARLEIGRNVIFYTPTNQDTEFVASGFYNPITFSGFMTVLEQTEVLARVHWASDERITATPGGKYYVGDCTLGVDPMYHDLAQRCMNSSEGKVSVDNKYVTITAIDPMGAPTVNRLRLVCKSVGTKPEA